MSVLRCTVSLLVVLLCMLLTDCQQYQYVSGAKLGLRDYPDAVVHINQVDPQYRHHFAAQHGSSFSLSDQRKAFTAAKETARTPVKESAYRPAKATPRRKVVHRGKKSARGKKYASRAKKSSSKAKKRSSKGKKKASTRRSSKKRRR